MEVFTACSFQDITGQRIAKVVSTMAYVEQRVASMIAMWGGEGTIEGGVRTSQSPDKGDAEAATSSTNQDPDAHLLNGPQMPGFGLGQDAVDALFGGDTTAKPAASPAAVPVAPITAAAPAAPASAPKPAPAPVATATQAKPPAKPKLAPKLVAAAIAAAAPAAAPAKLDQSAVDALFN